ncbi:MAG: ArsA family ATPase [Deltaproteobacteria bacterium]|nr:ArsA family ATPase [Deltaproteobacteria bacterium]
MRIITGKGGVGKTTVAAAMGLALARTGHRVLVAEVNGRDRVAAALGVEPVGSELREVLPNLFVVDMNPRAALREYILLLVRFETVYKAVFENRMARRVLRFIPSLGELNMLGKVWYHEQQQEDGRPRFDAIIVDAPATGHARELLRAPGVVEKMVPAGPLRDNARVIREMLSDAGRTALHVVTTPEEMPVNEAIELYDAARTTLSMSLGAALINQRVAALSGEAIDRLGRELTDPRLAGMVTALKLREQKRAAGEEELARLPAALSDRVVSLPRLVASPFGRAELDQLASHLEILA